MKDPTPLPRCRPGEATERLGLCGGAGVPRLNLKQTLGHRQTGTSAPTSPAWGGGLFLEGRGLEKPYSSWRLEGGLPPGPTACVRLGVCGADIHARCPPGPEAPLASWPGLLRARSWQEGGTPGEWPGSDQASAPSPGAVGPSQAAVAPGPSPPRWAVSSWRLPGLRDPVTALGTSLTPQGPSL